MAASTPSRCRMAATRSRMLGMLRRLPCKVVAKLEMRIVEVKRHQSLEECHTLAISFALELSKHDSSNTRQCRNRFVVLAAAMLAIAGVACGDFTGVPASLPTVTDTGTRVRHQRRARRARRPRCTCSAERCSRPTRASSSTSRSTSMPRGTSVHPAAARRGERFDVHAHRRAAEGERRLRRVDRRRPSPAITPTRRSWRRSDQVVVVQSSGPERLRRLDHRHTLYAKLVVTADRSRREAADSSLYRRSELRLLLVRGRHSEGLTRARPSSAPRADRSAPRRHAPSRRARRARAGHRSRRDARP